MVLMKPFVFFFLSLLLFPQVSALQPLPSNDCDILRDYYSMTYGECKVISRSWQSSSLDTKDTRFRVQYKKITGRVFIDTFANSYRCSDFMKYNLMDDCYDEATIFSSVMDKWIVVQCASSRCDFKLLVTKDSCVDDDKDSCGDNGKCGWCTGMDYDHHYDTSTDLCVKANDEGNPAVDVCESFSMGPACAEKPSLHECLLTWGCAWCEGPEDYTEDICRRATSMEGLKCENVYYSYLAFFGLAVTLVPLGCCCVCCCCRCCCKKKRRGKVHAQNSTVVTGTNYVPQMQMQQGQGAMVSMPMHVQPPNMQQTNQFQGGPYSNSNMPQQEQQLQYKQQQQQQRAILPSSTQKQAIV
eukprot:TRINITY_DN6864_c0_g1_i1.p1 TRINITY_DN6864_c0_g1~~TRINITY_DN6864_c0_g1_i1.p1  ORF type:complete len:355 (-),score=64.75 TRINITY_DN6864_c0_g1_i1:522-1586(-)